MTTDTSLWLPPGARSSGIDSREKAADLEALSRSVVGRPPVEQVDRPVGANFLMWVGAQADGFTQWGYNPKLRDRQLREFFPTENLLASALGTVVARNSALSWKISGDEKTAEAAQAMLNNANFGAGWEDFIARLSIDLYTTDSGAFIEFVREKDSPDSPVIGITSLDSLRCYSTGVPEFPVVYEDTRGIFHRMPWYSIVQLLEMPSAATPWYAGFFYRLQFCLAPDATVRMADGSTKRIRDVVRDRDEGPVMALGPDGQMEPKRITNWYDNPRAGREWINVRGRLSSIGRGNKRRNTWMTEDHPVLTPDGWMDAGTLQTGTPIVTEYPAPNDLQMALIVGTLLGDASMPRANMRPRLTIGHKAEHRDWSTLKANALSEFGATIADRSMNGHPMAIVETKAQPAFVPIREQFYDAATGKKGLPLDLIEQHFSPLMLATWYLDDGNIAHRSEAVTETRYHGFYGDTARTCSVEGCARPLKADELCNMHYMRRWRYGDLDAGAKADHRSPTASIGCSRLTWEQAESAATMLTAHGFEARVVHQDATRPRLNFTVAGSAALFAAIAPYVPAVMRYKLPPDAAPFDPERWELGAALRFVDEAVVERGGRLGERAYCIDVEDDHNFVTAGIVVHNCALTRVLKAAQIMKSLSTYKDEKISGRYMRALHLISGVDEVHVRDAMARASMNADNRGQQRYMEPAIIGSVDPSAAIGHTVVELASLPDGFDEHQTFTDYIVTLALGFLTDPQEFAPLPGGGLGSGMQSETLSAKSRGKGPGLFQKLLLRLLNQHGALPSNVQFEFDEPDMDAQEQEDRTANVRAQERSSRLASGEIDPEAARAIALEAGDLTQEQYDELEKRAEERKKEMAAQMAAQSAAGVSGAPGERPASTPGQPVEGEDKPGVKPAADGPTPGEEQPGAKMVTVTAMDADGDFDAAFRAAPAAAGLAVVAAATGRVLMLQRALVDGDPAGGTWEFPGGKIDEGESPLDAARREWTEETGADLPAGEIVSDWSSPDGVYRGFVYRIASEDDVPLFDEPTNPDDPDGDMVEVIAWWDAEHLRGNPALRREVAGSLAVMLDALAVGAKAFGAKGTVAETRDEAEARNPQRGDVSKLNAERLDYEAEVGEHIAVGLGAARRLVERHMRGAKHGDHDQSEHGNWASGGGTAVAEPVSGRGIRKVIERQGGATVDVITGKQPLKGYAVAVYPDREHAIAAGADFHDRGRKEIDDYIDKNADVLLRGDMAQEIKGVGGRAMFGAWVSGGKVILDVSIVVADRRQAVELAKTYKQQAIYDLATGTEIQTGGPGGAALAGNKADGRRLIAMVPLDELVDDPDARARLHERIAAALEQDAQKADRTVVGEVKEIERTPKGYIVKTRPIYAEES